MPEENFIVIGIYPTNASLESGVQALKNAGFRNSDVSVLYQEKRQTPRPPSVTSSNGAGGGSLELVGGVLGWLAGADSLAIPGNTPLIAVGPLVAALSAAGSGGAAAGLAAGLASLGVAEADASRYEARLREGAALLSLHPDNDYWAGRAREVMEHSGAQNISLVGKTTNRS